MKHLLATAIFLYTQLLAVPLLAEHHPSSTFSTCEARFPKASGYETAFFDATLGSCWSCPSKRKNRSWDAVWSDTACTSTEFWP